MLAHLEIQVGVHDVAHTLLHIVAVDITPGDGHSIHGNDIGAAAVFVAKRVRQAQRDVHISLGFETFSDTEVSRSQSSKYMRRKLPSKH